MANIVSYNCNSIRNNAETLKSLLEKCDILCLQEIMLEKKDTDISNDFNPNFKHIVSVRDRETEGICEGRPSSGIAIFWRATLSPFISPVIVDDSIIGVVLQTKNFKILIMNVYLPYDKRDTISFDKYSQSLIILENVIRKEDVNQVVILGDFNADPNKGRFWKLFKDFEKSLSLLEMDHLFPSDTFTYLCPSQNSTSWLDHISSSKEVAGCIKNVSVGYNQAIFDHFPVHFTLDVSISNSSQNEEKCTSYEFVNWKKMHECDKQKIRDFIDRKIEEKGLLNREVFECNDMNCKHQTHKSDLAELLSLGKDILLESTDEFSFVKDKCFKIIPGWNDSVKKLYAIARDKFLIWKDNGKIRNSSLEEEMKRSRSEFKIAFKACKDDEKNIRSDKLLTNMIDKDYSSFWKEVYKTNKHNMASPNEIDGKNDPNDICNLFSEKYKDIFNRENDTSLSDQELRLNEKEKQ